MEKFIVETFLLFVIQVFGLLVLYVLFVILPFYVWTESECLAAGYPKARVDVFLNGYCITVDGYIQAPVIKASELPKGTQ